jgi:hypothetical protein
MPVGLNTGVGHVADAIKNGGAPDLGADNSTGSLVTEPPASSRTHTPPTSRWIFQAIAG